MEFEQEKMMEQALANDLIDVDSVQRELELTKRAKILQQHKYAITESQDGKCRTYLPDPLRPNNRRQIKRNTRAELEDAIVAFYKEQEAKKKLTLEKLYPEWLDYYSLHVEAVGTVKRVSTDWKKYYKDDPIIKKPISQLTKVELDTWVHRMVKDHDMTKTMYYNMSLPLRKMLAYAEDCGYIEDNPFAKVHVDAKLFRKKKKPASETQVYTLEEEIAIIDAARADFEEHPTVTTPLAVILMFYLGVRVGEIVAFKESDIEGNEICVNRMERMNIQKVGKTGFKQDGRILADHAKTAAGSRRIYLVQDARKVIETVLETNRKNGCGEDAFLFMEDGKRIDDNLIRGRLKKYCRQAGIPYRSPHKIRKTFISKLIDSGMNINAIREMVGHEDERTTLNSYCFNRKSKDQTRTDLEQTLVIAENRQFKAKTEGGATIIPFKQKDTEKLQNGVSKGNQK